MADGHPTDPLLGDLLGIYRRTAIRLELTVDAGIRRGLRPGRLGTEGQRVGDATLAYRRRQLDQAREILAELDREVARAAPVIVGRAYRSGVVAVDRTLGDAAKVRGEFGRVHVRGVEALAAGMTDSLRAATARAGTNVEAVFARADALAGPLPGTGRVGDVPFIGRRIDDPYRRIALDTVAGGLAGLDTRPQVSAALVDRLVTEGVTDATTGFVDRAGNRWSLERYGAMVARTTTREATTAATRNRLVEQGQDLVTVSEHDHPADECSDYEGVTFSLTGASGPNYPILDASPPFHPNCVHVLTPATDNLDVFEAELEGAALEIADRDAAAAPPAPEPVTPPPPPAGLPPTIGTRGGAEYVAPNAIDTGGARARAEAAERRAAEREAAADGSAFADDVPPDLDPGEPAHANVESLIDVRAAGVTPADPPFGNLGPSAVTPDYLERLQRQRLQRLVDNDRGPEPGYLEAARDAFDRDQAASLSAYKRDVRRRRRDVNAQMGPELAKYIDRVWGQEDRVRQRFEAGELTLEDVQDLAMAQYRIDEYRTLERERDRELRRTRTTRPRCQSCNRYIRRPADICEACGFDNYVPGEGASNVGSNKRVMFSDSGGGQDTDSDDRRRAREQMNRAYGFFD